ncbi:DEAD/DEAH box helicase family protein [Chloracidobacterium aggregatum]|uniref:DEAD/DEAH box helicase family protein n=1 Tax=Chloracidobacterium aggregatum TaxID=2851959 RepID=UPI002017DDEF|nr:DEAD/DEAH box helicase family protein [Chloracidobacterium aggregatum]
MSGGRPPAGGLRGGLRRFPGFDDAGIFVEIPLVNQIAARQSLARGRLSGCDSITSGSWSTGANSGGVRRAAFFFCQLEAVETLIWLTETPAPSGGHHNPSDGGDFDRQCCKMATGTGKTVVMAMVIAWHISTRWRTAGRAFLEERARHCARADG